MFGPGSTDRQKSVVESGLRMGTGEEIKKMAATIPQQDLIKLTFRQGRDIHHFGVLENFDINSPPTNVHNAYIIYLTAVMYREQGRNEEAIRLFQLLTETNMGLPDLYRCKALCHLADILVNQGSHHSARQMVKNALRYCPDNPEARCLEEKIG
jgi:hypothetical protein